MSSYVINLLYKDKYFCDNIKNMGNLDHGWKNMSNKLQIWKRFLAPIIVEAIAIVF